MEYPSEWPEPVVSVQSLCESGIAIVPPRYVKPVNERPLGIYASSMVSIPVVDLGAEAVAEAVSTACREWGFFHAVNHGVSPKLLRRALKAWRGFFDLPNEAKEAYANNPRTYEGYGSRLGIEKGAILDWGDFFYLHYFPLCLKNRSKWPSQPPGIRETVDEYGNEVRRLCERIMGMMSTGLGLEEGELQRAFGGEEAGACLRANYYPRCPQPELTLGLSSHSDPGGITVLLPDYKVKGLQVRHRGRWVTVQPVRDAFVVSVGDLVQILSNSIYRSVEHRVLVNSELERASLAFFYNPKSDLHVAPIRELVGPGRAALYKPITFDQYRVYIRKHGPHGKSQVDSLMTDIDPTTLD